MVVEDEDLTLALLVFRYIS